MSHEYDALFQKLTGHAPFPWQRRLYEQFISDTPKNIPQRCAIPTGLGKTNVIAVWLVAWITHAGKRPLPRRLVYVVNRRTVVDQTTTEVETILGRVKQNPDLPDRVRNLAISTLRGQYADNRQWSADPSRLAVICGTVDMIGSRLLFSGYGVGYRSKPLHAGFLGQDVLLVHDEAHLEPAFQMLLEKIQAVQENERRHYGELPWPGLRVMELTATTRSDAENDNNEDAPELLNLETEDRQHPIVKQRLEANKHLRFTPVDEEKQVAESIAKHAVEYKNSQATVLIFVRTLEAFSTIEKELEKTKRRVLRLTGTMRGKEREDLIECPDFQRFFKGAGQGDTVYLVCTSAGEVGIDISADHLVCDLSTFESMAQRLGRVHRYGEPVEHVAQIDVVHPVSFGKLDKKTGELQASEIDRRRHKTLELLKQLPPVGDQKVDVSPQALTELRQRPDLAYKVSEAFAPMPTILPATEMLFDAWALTSIRQPLPGRPPVEPYLHGIREWEPPETQVAWREEAENGIADALQARFTPAELLELLEDYPLKPQELLRDRSDRVIKQLELMANRHPQKFAWLIDEKNELKIVTLSELADKQRKDRIQNGTILLPPSAGGLTRGMLDGASDVANDVSEIPLPSPMARIRVWSDGPDRNDTTAKMRRVRSVEIAPDEGGDETESRLWDWFEFPIEGGRLATRPVAWQTHVEDVVEHTVRIVELLSLPTELAQALLLAAELHDHGKQREWFQVALGNYGFPAVILAKAGKRGARLPEPFRHEFGSLLDAQSDDRFQNVSQEYQDVILHVIASHHGRARPHFAANEAFDFKFQQSIAETMAIEVPRRFAQLQRKYGRWGLAYLESLLRAADWAASADPSEYVDELGVSR